MQSKFLHEQNLAAFDYLCIDTLYRQNLKSEIRRDHFMIDILNRDPMGLADMQEFHQRLDKAKGFDTDFVKNVAYMIAEVGEVLNAFRMIDKAQNSTEKEAHRDHVAEELADCLAYLLKLANYAEIDLESAYISKMNRNISRTWHNTETTSTTKGVDRT